MLDIAACDVKSETGTGISSEGGTLTVRNTTVHNCAGNGVSLFADLEGVSCSAYVQDCSISDNSANGILAREDSHLTIKNTKVSGNQGYGLTSKVRFGSTPFS